MVVRVRIYGNWPGTDGMVLRVVERLGVELLCYVVLTILLASTNSPLIGNGRAHFAIQMPNSII